MALDLSALDDATVAPAEASSNGLPAQGALALFEEDPDNPRFEETPLEFAALVADVRERGILQPIVVRRMDDGRLRIRFGARRYRAAVKLGLAGIPYVVTKDPRQFDGYAQVAENERRAALQPIELATFIAKRIALGESKKVVARKVGMHPSAITHLLCLIGDAPPFLMELYHSRRCRSPQYLYRLLQLWRQNPLLVEQACAAAADVDGTMIDNLSLHVQTSLAGGAASDDAKEAKEVQGQSKLMTEGGESEAEASRNTASTALAVRPQSPRLVRPVLYGSIHGRPVWLDLRTRPTAEGRVVVRYCDDGAVAEVDISTIMLTKLVDAAE